MKSRKLTIAAAVFAAVVLCILFFITRPSEPAVSVQPAAEPQVASTEKTYTDSTVLGVSSDESTRANTPIDVNPRPATTTIRVPVRTASISPPVQPAPPTPPPLTEAAPETPVEVCDDNYVQCVPVVESDLACSDIAIVVYVKGEDKHFFDDDRDGVGCEEYANDPAAELPPVPPSPITLTDDQIINILQDDTPDTITPQP